MKTLLRLTSRLALVALLLAPASAFAQTAPASAGPADVSVERAGLERSDPSRDRVVFGGDVFVGPGEVVRDAVAFGGDTVVEGLVLGDAVAFGGDVLVRGEGAVRGDVTSFGGAASSSAAAGDASADTGAATPGARPAERGPLDGFLHWV